MNFSKFDIKIILVMATAIILMILITSSLGLVSDDVSANDVPEFNPNYEEFQIDTEDDAEFGDMQGTLRYVAPANVSDLHECCTHENQEWLHRIQYVNGTTKEGTQIAFGEDIDSTPDNRTMEFYYTYIAEGDGVILPGSGYEPWLGDENQFTIEENETIYMDSINGEPTQWEIEFTYTDSYYQDDKWIAELEYEVQHNPYRDTNNQDSGFLAGLNIIADAITWFLTFMYNIIISLLLLLWETISFTIGFVIWINTSYFEIVDTVSGIASVIVLIPGIIMYLETAKMVFIGISLLPTT